MKNSSNIPSVKSKTLGLLLAAMVPTGAALADGGYHRHDRGVEVSGEVVVKQRAPEKVVIIEREPVREKVVIVKERPAREKVVIVEQHGRRHRPARNIIVHEDRNQVSIQDNRYGQNKYVYVRK